MFLQRFNRDKKYFYVTKKVIIRTIISFYNISTMKVCIEYVILDNLIMNYLLLKETSIILKVKFKKVRLLSASIIGVIGAVIFPLLQIKREYSFLLKILLGLLIVFVAVKHFSLNGYLKYFNVFLLFTFLIGGAVIGVFYLMNVDISKYSSNPSVLPVGVSVGLAYIVAITVKSIAKKSVNGLITDKYRYKCIINSGQASIRVQGYFDSGNMLVDWKTGLPIVLCKRSVIQKILKEGGKISSPRKTEISTVSSYKSIDLYEIDSMLIKREKDDKKVVCLLGEVDNSSMQEELLFGVYVM